MIFQGVRNQYGRANSCIGSPNSGMVGPASGPGTGSARADPPTSDTGIARGVACADPGCLPNVGMNGTFFSFYHDYWIVG